MINKYFTAFIVQYEDGSTSDMFIGKNALSSGDEVVRRIAREKQKHGELPAGKITDVRRADET